MRNKPTHENYNERACPPVGVPHVCTRFAYDRLAGLALRANLAPSPFHFSYFFQNANIGHGGLVSTINAYYAVRSGAAYVG